MSTKTKEKVVQIIMVKPIWKRVAWIIPIEKTGANNFITGQNLSFDKMIGKIPLTDEEMKKYPFVIDPLANYKVPDRQPFNVTVDELGVPLNPRDMALYNLILMTGEIAKNKIDYDINPVKYIGYFYDKESEAIRGNEIDDLRYEAETLVRNAGIDLRKKIALLLNYKVPDKDFFINLATVSDDILKRELVKVTKEHPELLMSCFPEKNPGIEAELFVVELLHYKIITQKPDGDIYSGVKYLGKTVEEVTKTLSKQDMQPDINKWGIILNEMKGSKSIGDRSFLPPSAKDISHLESPVERFQELATRMKAAILDEDVESAKGFMIHLRQVYREVVRDHPGYAFDFDRYEKEISKLIVPEDGGNGKYEDLTLEQIHKKITHHMTPFKKEECEDIWNDREKLIEYMTNK